jgi:hypothetical protein|tara:strand:- start:30 stop:314 length:285 start_codon:yes stop_codon:yes gene_type:complete
MKITKQQLKQIIREELSEIEQGPVDSMPAPSGADQGVGIVRQHLGEIVADLAEGELLPHLPSTMPDSGRTAVVPDLDGLAAEMYRMIMVEMGAT